jgi:hypothetical protein
MYILLKIFFNTYVKSIASAVYLIILIILLINFNISYKFKETVNYEFDYSIIVNSISEYKKLQFQIIEDKNIYGIVVNHHEDFQNKNKLELKLNPSTTRTTDKDIYRDSFEVSSKEGALSDELFEDYLNSLEKNFENKLIYNYERFLETNNLTANLASIFFYKQINNLDKNNLINENVSLTYSIPLQLGSLVYEFNNNENNPVTQGKYFKTYFDKINLLKDNFKFPISFKTNDYEYTYTSLISNNQNTKRKISFSILLIFILLIILHPLLRQKLNELLAKNR